MTIVTEIDGTENRVSCPAKMEYSAMSAVIRYQDANAEVTISVDGNDVLVDRKGDYGLYLPLREKEKTTGTLSIGGNCGPVEIYTERLVYTIGKNTLLMQLHYSLLFGAEKQEMRLRIHAKQNHLEEK